MPTAGFVAARTGFVASAMNWPASGARIRPMSQPRQPSPSDPSAAAALPAFVQLFNLRAVAVVFYLCLAMALSRALGWYGYSDMGSLEEWLHGLVRYTRQSLLTGLAMLLAAALAEAAIARWQRLGARPRLLLRALAVGLGALAGTWARHVVANWGDPGAVFKWSWALSTAMLWFMLGAIVYAALHAARAEQTARCALVEAARQHERLQAQQLEAQLLALNAQIEPHFLFNTLANVKRLYETAPERGRDMLLSLIAYLRAALPGMRRSESTLAQELELVRNYLSILQMRMGERLRFEIDSPAELGSSRLPPMVLPTLVENAIKHGLSPLPEGGRIAIAARRSGTELRLEVRDDGQGFGGSGGGAGVGLANTRARLAALFGAAAALELEAASPRGVIARLRLPLEVRP